MNMRPFNTAMTAGQTNSEGEALPLLRTEGSYEYKRA